MTSKTTSQPQRFISIRWRAILPLFVVFVMIAATAAYAFANDAALSLTPAARQMVSLLAATAAALVVTAVFVLLTLFTSRINRVTRVAQSLTTGNGLIRTNMQPTDEIGRMGKALDEYADYVQERQDELRDKLRRKRREVAHLNNVIESIPDGVIVQDLDGRVIMMNEKARQLLGSQRVFRSAKLHELTAIVTDTLGAVIAPGLYSLGDPMRVGLDDKILSAQAAAIMTPENRRQGTVVLVRDITEHVKQERARDELLKRLESDIQQPLADMARRHSKAGIVTDLMMNDFNHQVSQHARALQKMIADIREISDASPEAIEREQIVIPLETLIWAVSNEWRQIAHASSLQVQVSIEQKGLYILGDERRLRWAIGNIVDNAIKYTPEGGTITLEIKGEESNMAHLRIRDNGAGISVEDLPHIFTRFFRGTPVLPDGRVIHAPGMGQGLYVTRQIIEAHGGMLKIKSKVGVGTAVYFSLPLTSPHTYALPPLYEDMDGETMPVQTRQKHNGHH